jgi:hypothetical protein
LNAIDVQIRRNTLLSIFRPLTWGEYTQFEIHRERRAPHTLRFKAKRSESEDPPGGQFNGPVDAAVGNRHFPYASGPTQAPRREQGIPVPTEAVSALDFSVSRVYFLTGSFDATRRAVPKTEHPSCMHIDWKQIRIEAKE